MWGYVARGGGSMGKGDGVGEGVYATTTYYAG